ncbi:MAG: PLP-dependent aminotransferase family protein [Chloroflexota bacterium]|nr:PLP-dependent aminotransferase family protein [Chloroflexota bacterium]
MPIEPERGGTAEIAVRQRTARRAKSYGDSIWEELAALFDRHPHMVYFGDGSPAKDAMPVERLKHAAATAWELAPDMLGYGESAGFEPLRALIARRMAARGIHADPSTILVTNGSTQGIELTAKLMLDPGDAVIIEEPTFVGALQTYAGYEARFVPVPMDAEGMRIDALERALASDERIKIIYTIPTFQNPTGVTMPLARREALLSLARARAIMVVEDDPYGELRYDGEPVPPLRALDPTVVHLGTFSKTIAPALRVGWMVAPPEFIPPFIAAREAADISNERLTMRTVYHTAVDFLDGHVAGARALYRGRRDALLAGLAANMPPGVQWSRPEGGFFVWVTLPEGSSTDDLMPRAADQGVIFFPGSWFYPNQDVHNALRLSFSTLTEEMISEGTKRLGAAIRAYLRVETPIDAEAPSVHQGAPIPVG